MLTETIKEYLDLMEDAQLAIIRNVGYGMRDFDSRGPGLWFDVNFKNGSALQCLFGEEANEFIRASGVYDVKNLEGKPVWIRCEDMMVRVVAYANDV